MGAKHSTAATTIDIHNKDLKKIPETDLSSHIDLQEIKITKCDVEKIDKWICALIPDEPTWVKTLMKLDLSSNSLSELPDEFCLLLNLKILKLPNNFLKVLPRNFFALYKLEKLILNNNMLESLPIGIANLKNLKILKLQKNKLTWLPRELGFLPGYTNMELSIHENPFKDEFLKDVQDLEELFRALKCGKTYQPSDFDEKEKELIKCVHQNDFDHKFIGGKIYAFQLLLEDVPSVAEFRKFLAKEFAEENLDFYLAVNEFRQNEFYSMFPINSCELRNAARALYHRFIIESINEKSYSINIPSDIKRRIESSFLPDNIKNLNQWVFSEAFVHIAKLMLDDSLKRFCETPKGKSIWSKFEKYEKERSIQSKKYKELATLEHRQKMEIRRMERMKSKK